MGKSKIDTVFMVEKPSGRGRKLIRKHKKMWIEWQLLGHLKEKNYFIKIDFLRNNVYF